MTTAAIDARASRRCHNALNSLHSTHYFSPDLGRELGDLGVTDPRAVNFAVRAAALGPVGAGAVTATFYNYKHDLVARHVPAVWETATPAQVLAARARAVDATLRRLLGDRDPGVRGDVGGRRSGAARRRGLLPQCPSAVLRPRGPARARRAAPGVLARGDLLREHRGDGHLAALMAAGLDGLEALVTHTATGKGMAPKWIFTTRGWTQEEWRRRRTGCATAA